MKQIVFIAILIGYLSTFTFAVDFSLNDSFVKFDEYTIFDEYQNLNIKDERERLENLFRTIEEDNLLKGLIVLKFNKNESEKKKTKRLYSIAKYFDVRGIDKTKFSFAIFNDDKTQTIFYVEPVDANLELLLPIEAKNYKIIKGEELAQDIRKMFPGK